MVIDEDIAEMLAYAIAHPRTGTKNIKSYQRRLSEDLTITLYITGDAGHVSLTATRMISEEENLRVMRTLASLSCLPNGNSKENEYFVSRYRFFNPLQRHPVFASALDKYLPTVKPSEASRWTPLKRTDRPPPPPRPAWHYSERSESSNFNLPVVMNKPTGPYWQSLSDNQCHICHRPLTDPFSIRVGIGSTCRKRIQEAEGNDGIWEDISREELERIWTQHNLHDRHRRERAGT